MSSFSISRISDPLKNHQLTKQLHGHQLAIQRLYDQLATGNRVSSVGDDPVAASRAMALQRGIGRAEQLSRNASITRSFYAATDVALGTLGDVLIAARGATVEAAQNVLSAEEREAIAAGLDQAVRTAVEAANSVFREHQLLGGHLQPATTLQYQDSFVAFRGNDMVGETFVGWTSPIATGVSGVEAFGLASPVASGRDLSPAPLVAGDPAPRITANTPLASLDGGAGLDVSAGLQIRQGTQTFDVDLSTASTVGDVLVAINRSGAQVRAEIASDGRSLVIRGLASGIDLAIGENGGQVASDLGLRTATLDTPLSDLNHGLGVVLTAHQPDLLIRRTDGSELAVELEGAETIGQVLDRINQHPDNQDAAAVVATLNTHGNGITLTAAAAGQPLAVRSGGAGNAAVALGLVPPGQTEATAIDQAGASTLVGGDYTPRQAGGAIDTLIRLAAAVRSGDTGQIEQLQNQLDQDREQALQIRGRVGMWSQELERLQDVAETNAIELKGQLSGEVEADLAAVISEINARETAREASLRMIAEAARMTLLDFL